MHGDLHTHTTFSDGSCEAGRLPVLAARAGLTHLAVSDHDSVQCISLEELPLVLQRLRDGTSGQSVPKSGDGGKEENE